jgi:hypothetical protein
MGSEGVAPGIRNVATDGGDCSPSCPDRAVRTGKERAVCTGWVGPRAGLEGLKQNILSLSGIKPASLDASGRGVVYRPSPRRQVKQDFLSSVEN